MQILYHSYVNFTLTFCTQIEILTIMNSKIRTQIFISVFVAVIISFGAGYFTGNSSFSLGQTNAQASEKVDMAPFWRVWNALDERFVSASTTMSISDEDKLYAAIAGLTEAMDDPYTVFLPPQQKTEFDESITGTFSGVGMEVGSQEGVLTVIAPLKNSPAEKAGILSGDKIAAIDGKDAVDMKVEEAVSLIRGEKGTTITLKIYRKGENTSRDISIVRDTIVVPTIETETQGDVFVIRLYTFGTAATTEFKEALRKFTQSGKKKLILDLRGNPGGYLDAAVDVSSWFLPAGKTIVSEDFGSGQTAKVFRSKGYNIFDKDLKMIILVNGGSASASEIVAGALQEYDIATVVGEQTYGKGSVQELIDITEDTALKVTIARWLTPEGKSISNGGLTPDIIVEFDNELYKEKKIDTQFQKALELLK
jgi:carboxyl-terminal processing protease